jgi:hypothetical protein
MGNILKPYPNYSRQKSRFEAGVAFHFGTTVFHKPPSVTETFIIFTIQGHAWISDKSLILFSDIWCNMDSYESMSNLGLLTTEILLDYHSNLWGLVVEFSDRALAYHVCEALV